MERRAEQEQFMSRAVEMISQGAERGGAVVAVSSWGIYTLEWLNHNSSAVLALCGIVGALISMLGFAANQYYRYQAHKLELRQRRRRAN